MDIWTSAVDAVVKNCGDIISGYFLGEFSDDSKLVQVSRSTVKKYGNKCVPTILLNHVNTAAKI